MVSLDVSDARATALVYTLHVSDHRTSFVRARPVHTSQRWRAPMFPWELTVLPAPIQKICTWRHVLLSDRRYRAEAQQELAAL
jgi:hypothetical protein